MRDLCCIFHSRMSAHVCSYPLNVIICMFVYTYTSMNWPIDQLIEVYILTPPSSKKFSWAFCICHLIYLYTSYSIRCPSCFLKLWRQRPWIPASVYKLSKIKREPLVEIAYVLKFIIFWLEMTSVPERRKYNSHCCTSIPGWGLFYLFFTWIILCKK